VGLVTVLPRMATTPLLPERATQRLSRRGLAIFVVAAIAIVVATVVGVRGLLSSPIESVAADGTTTLRGTWEPYSCDAHACEGYVQAGARSVFVVMRAGCPQPARAADITVAGRLDPSLGSGSYRATTCPG
jgi:hypothetical protein